MQCRQRLGCRFGKNQHDERQQQRAERDGRFPAHFESDDGDQ